MNQFRYPVRQNQMLIVKSHPLMSLYTNPASCISAAVFDEKRKTAALTHTLNPYLQQPMKQHCVCKPEDYINELPHMADIKRKFIEKHSDCIIEYHSCELGSFTDISIRYLYQRFGNRDQVRYHLIGASTDKPFRSKNIPVGNRIRQDLNIIFQALKLTEDIPQYLAINEVNLISAISSMICGRTNIESLNVYGSGVRIFDFFSDTGKIIFSPKTTVKHPVVFTKDDLKRTKLAALIRSIVLQAH